MSTTIDPATALRNLLSALSPLTVMGKPIASLDTALDQCITEAVLALNPPAPEPTPLPVAHRDRLRALVVQGWYKPGEAYPVISAGADAWIKEVSSLAVGLLDASAAFHARITNIADDYVPDRAQDAGLALSEMREALHGALADHEHGIDPTHAALGSVTTAPDKNAETHKEALAHLLSLVGFINDTGLLIADDKADQAYRKASRFLDRQTDIQGASQ